jgi:hypothetical protein
LRLGAIERAGTILDRLHPPEVAELLEGFVPAEQRGILERHVAWARAQLGLSDGKRHFLEGSYREAVASLAAANRVLRRGKLTLAIFALRLAPGLLRRAYLARHRRLGSSVERVLRHG